MTLTGEKVFLRALEPEDLDFLYRVENDVSLWEVSNTLQPYSKYLLKQYLENAHRDIFEVKQLRLVICVWEHREAIGLLDLYDFDPQHGRAGIGIVIAAPENRGHGYAKEALSLLQGYAVSHLGLHQLYAAITADNGLSKQLFEAVGFRQTGIRKDWIRVGGQYKDELFYQWVDEQS